MRGTFERGTRVRLSFSDRPHAPVNMAGGVEEVNVCGKKCRKWHICCTVLRYILYAKFLRSLKVLWDFHRLFGSRNSPSTSILSTMLTGACGPPERLSLALPLRSNVLRMTVKLAY